MISINENGIIRIPVGNSLEIIDDLLSKGDLDFSKFSKTCNEKARKAHIIGENEEIDEDIRIQAFDAGIKRLNYLLNLNKTLDKLVYVPQNDETPNYRKIFRFKEENFTSGIFLKPQYSYSLSIFKKKMDKCDISRTECAKFIDKLLSTGKVFSSQDLYNELEREYCWVELNVKAEDIAKNANDNEDCKLSRARLFRDCYSSTQKKAIQFILEHLIVKDRAQLLIRRPYPYYQKEHYYNYAIAGMTAMNEQGEFPEFTAFDNVKIHVINYFEAEIKKLNKKKKKKGEDYLSIGEINKVTKNITDITDVIKEQQISSSLNSNLEAISKICTAKKKGWQEKYVSLLNKIQKDFRTEENNSRSLIFADLLATHAQLLGKYGYAPNTDQGIKDQWFATICGFYEEMIEIAKSHASQERHARYLIKYANFLRKQSKYADLDKKYSEAIKIYESVIIEKASTKLKHDYAYALRSLSKYSSDYDRIDDAIDALIKSMSYLDESNSNEIADTLMQLAICYAELGDYVEVREILLQKVLPIYRKMANFDKNYNANIANVYTKLLRSYSPDTFDTRHRHRLEKIEKECLGFLDLYKRLFIEGKSTNDKIYARALTSLSLFYLDTRQSEKARNTCNDALQIHKLIRNNEGHYNKDIINHHFYLGRALGLQTINNSENDLYESLDNLLFALDNLTAIKNDNPYVPFIMKDLANTNLALAETYEFLAYKEQHNKNDYLGLAREKYSEAIKIYTELSQDEKARHKYIELLKKAQELLSLI